ncbi:DUF1266 domain-containing protein [Rhodococcus sp. HNM0569]|uniref:DUF1266 domain-containing protein n=1 Tax=Rhodococcus sp. HNM0569 TaxID=2716340 RepID=UPI00146C2168|nr:DUF1266 domain-containing protein [Rhodococcus sp. HNM0569]NLU85122.1 DUF1266 domain-containing protein [Rhodococcus sp. HNM0569]
MLKDLWSVTGNASWAEATHTLLAGRNIGHDGENVLEVRTRIATETGLATITTAEWLAAIERACHANAFAEESIEGFKARAQRISRYESRMRADGLLPPEGFVTSVRAYDYGRAASMANWGFGAEYCTREEAENILCAAALRAQRTYVSWEHFSAGYILGRILRFDDDSAGPFYESTFQAHRILTSDPSSPWRNIAFVG